MTLRGLGPHLHPWKSTTEMELEIRVRGVFSPSTLVIAFTQSKQQIKSKKYAHTVK